MTKFDEFGLPEPTKYPQMPKVIKMNERIKELAEQAGINMDSFQFSGTPIKHIVDEPSLEKFAELIVKECMGQVWYTREDGINGNVSQVIKDRIKEHFGVK